MTIVLKSQVNVNIIFQFKNKMSHFKTIVI